MHNINLLLVYSGFLGDEGVVYGDPGSVVRRDIRMGGVCQNRMSQFEIIHIGGIVKSTAIMIASKRVCTMVRGFCALIVQFLQTMK